MRYSTEVYFKSLLQLLVVALLSLMRMKALILVFQGCSPTMAYSYCCISATSCANKGNHYGTGYFLTDGHHRCFDWFSTRLEDGFHGEYKIACNQESFLRSNLSGEKCLNKHM